MDVEYDLRTERNLPVDSSKTDLPDVNTTPPFQEARQLEKPPRFSRRSFLKLTGSVALLSVLGAAYKILSGEKASAQVEDLGVGQDYTRTYVDALGNRIEWRVLNGTDGIPPNNPDHSIDKIFVSVNNSPKVAFQENETQFPSDTNQITVEGHWMNTKLNIAYVANTIRRNTIGGWTFPVVAILLDAKNVTNSPVVDASKQILVLDLLQNVGDGDRFEYFKAGTDSKGEFLKFRIQNSVNSKDNGDYMIRLDNNGLPIGGTVKIESAVMSRRGFIPFFGNAYTGK